MFIQQLNSCLEPFVLKQQVSPLKKCVPQLLGWVGRRAGCLAVCMAPLDGFLMSGLWVW